MNYNINREIENQIYDSIDKFLDEYLKGSTFGTRHAREILTKADFDSYFDGKKMTLKDAKKDFNKKTNLKRLITDLRYPGFQLFKKALDEEKDDVIAEERYNDLVKKILNKIIKDRMAHNKDKKTKKANENTVIGFNDFLNEEMQLITEMKLPIMKLDEILDGVTKVANKTIKTVLVTYFKTYIEYIDLIDKEKHMFKVNDMTGDVLNNNRISFEVIIFDKSDLMTIKQNMIKYSISEFYSTLPATVNVFGIDMKPSSFINKEELNTVFDAQITNQVVADTIGGVSGFNFEKKFNDFYIWSNKK